MSTQSNTQHTCWRKQGKNNQEQNASMHGLHKHNTRARMHGVSTKTNRLANAETTARYAQAGAKHAHTRMTCSASTRARHRTCRCRCPLA